MNRKTLYDFYRKIFPSSLAKEKQETIKKEAAESSLKVFVETGTYLGDTVEAVKNTFKEIYTIELDKTLYQRAKQRFSKEKHIKVIHGDSEKMLPEVLKNVNGPTLFWLDAHYSGGLTAQGNKPTPILEELKCILSHPIKDHVILVDDARYFNGKNGWPSLKEIRMLTRKLNPVINFQVRDNIIRIYL